MCIRVRARACACMRFLFPCFVGHFVTLHKNLYLVETRANYFSINQGALNHTMLPGMWIHSPQPLLSSTPDLECKPYTNRCDNHILWRMFITFIKYLKRFEIHFDGLRAYWTVTIVDVLAWSLCCCFAPCTFLTTVALNPFKCSYMFLL